MPRFRFSSLFWTFTGSILVVLIISSLLQAFILVAVMRPITKRSLQGEGEAMIQKASRRLAGVEGSNEEIITILGEVFAEHRARNRGAPSLLFKTEDGVTFATRSWGVRVTPPDGPPPPPRGRGPRRGRERGEHEGREPALTELSREVVVTGGGRQGSLAAEVWSRRLPMLPPGARFRTLLFLPLAVLLSGVAGLLLFRRLTGRIRNLETLAERVAEGDLDVRVAGHGNDEIGRLGEGLNRMTERLAAARDNEEAIEKQRRRLLADISHELATPLTSIRGYAETLLNPEVPISGEEQTDYLRNVLEESKRMDLLIADILELSRLESGAIELNFEKLEWASLCSNTVERFSARYREAGLQLHWENSIEHAWVKADGRRLEQVLENLLANALRYVPRGGRVVVSLSRPEDSPHLLLTVTDDGPGIPPDQLSHIFDRFYRADPARSSGGTGLGLAIVKEIVLRHGGTVHAEPSAPSGLTLIVALPPAP